MKQVIIIRKDLKMRRGKEIAQGSHASMAFLLPPKQVDIKILTEWMNGGQTKICLQVNSEEELLDLHEKAKLNGLCSHIITDLGRTEFNGVPTKTCMAIGPNKNEDIDKICSHLKLY